MSYQPIRSLNHETWEDFLKFHKEKPSVIFKNLSSVTPTREPEEFRFQVFFRGAYYELLRECHPPSHKVLINAFLQFETDNQFLSRGIDIFIEEGLGFYRSSMGPIIVGENFAIPPAGQDLFFDSNFRHLFAYGDSNPEAIQIL